MFCSFQFFSGFFDTNVGAKVDKESYLKIAEKAGVDAEDMLFLTDLPAGSFEIDSIISKLLASTKSLKIFWLCC